MKLSKIGDFSSGGTPSRGISDYWNGGTIPWLTTKEIGERYIEDSVEYITELGLSNSSAKIVEKNTIAIAMYGNTRGKISILKGKFATNQAFCNISVSNEHYFLYVYYKLKSEYDLFYKLGNGGAQQNISQEVIKGINMYFPPLDVQKEIGDKISVYDDKIENNNKIIELLEEKASLLYKRYFVDFEFPNEEGLPYKSSGGKLKESEVGEIPVEWDCKMIEEYTNVVTGKKNANAAVVGGEYKFFTCSKNDFLTDEYSFDGNAILIAGNGDFSVKRYNGKFDAYQRTYVLMPPINDVDWLFWHLKINLNEITSGHRGSVIKFITKSMLTDSKILECNDNNIKKKFYNINEYILSVNKENTLLEEKRDLLIKELIK
jgi:type I restriction enzyme S subunit